MLTRTTALAINHRFLQLWLRARSRISRKVHRLCDRIWQEYVNSDPLIPLQLTMLERVVSGIELAIPTGTVARQFNLKIEGFTAKKGILKTAWQRMAGIFSHTVWDLRNGSSSESVPREAHRSTSGKAVGVGKIDVIDLLVGKDDTIRNVGLVKSPGLMSSRFVSCGALYHISLSLSLSLSPIRSRLLLPPTPSVMASHPLVSCV